jgi:hypothetical protein
MSWLNWVLEELGIHHEEYVVPLEVFASIEEKRKKAAAKNATAAAESRKRKGQVGPKAVAKKLKTAEPPLHLCCPLLQVSHKLLPARKRALRRTLA